MKNLRETEIVDTGSLKRRWATYVTGIYILTLGVSLAIRAGIGISPQNSLTRTMTLVYTPLSQGTYNFILELIMLLLTYLPKAFKLKNFAGLIPAFVLALFLDMNLMLTKFIVLHEYTSKFCMLAFADTFIAFGLFLILRKISVLMPIDQFVNTIYKHWGWKWGNIKTTFNCTLLLISAGIGLTFFGEPKFIREGTIIKTTLF